jgi:large exoprotein involved in heme utilization and adhesion
MTRQLFKLTRNLRLGGAIILTGCFVSVFTGNDALAQITPDATLGAEPSIVTPLDAQGLPVDRIDGGAIRGTNLFHSFLEFNVATDRGAYFFSPANIQNILTRVTGGNAGDLTINTDALLVRDGARVSTATFGEGDGGNLTVNASQVQLIGSSADGKVPNGLFSQTQGTGDAGNLIVNTDTLLVRDGAQVSASTFGQGDGGNLTVNASQQVQVIGTSADGRYPSVLGASAVPGSSGNAGDLTITTNTLLVRDGAQVSASTFGQGDGRKLTVNASQVQLIGTTADGQFPSGLFAQTQGTGNAGDLTVNTRQLLLRDGAEVSASSTYGTGNGGILTVNASESVLLIDAVCCINVGNGFLGGLFTQTEEGGNAGDLTINTDYLLVRGGMSVSATTSGDASGDITVTANTVELINGGQLRTTTKASQDAGNIILRVRDRVSLAGTDSALLANTTENSSGNGGSIFINNPKTVSIQDGARIAVDSRGSGEGGNIEIQADTLTLQNQARLLAETTSNTGGNIMLQIQDLLLLRHASKISTTAGTDQAGGDGGNITIDADFIVGVPREDSDITANAFEGQGGNINITTQGIYGLKFRPRLTPLSDITASSEFGLDGEFQLDLLTDVDPSRGLAQLPTNVVDASNQIDRRCAPTPETQERNSFTITGRGGLPPSPHEPLQSESIITNWVTLDSDVETKTAPAPTIPQSSTPRKLVEAQGWMLNHKGEVVLTASAPTVTPNGEWFPEAKCDEPSVESQ